MLRAHACAFAAAQSIKPSRHKKMCACASRVRANAAPSLPLLLLVCFGRGQRACRVARGPWAVPRRQAWAPCRTRACPLRAHARRAACTHALSHRPSVPLYAVNAPPHPSFPCAQPALTRRSRPHARQHVRRAVAQGAGRAERAAPSGRSGLAECAKGAKAIRTRPKGGGFACACACCALPRVRWLPAPAQRLGWLRSARGAVAARVARAARLWRGARARHRH
jgi:hypothetical protein